MYLTRRNFIKYTGLSLPAIGLMSSVEYGPKDEVIIGHNEYKFKVKVGWGVLDPGTNPVNDCHEMVEDKQGRLLLLTNETKNNVLIYDKSGKLLESWGTSYPGAHGLTLYNDGFEESLFICDTSRQI
jgi:hypothetical protein